MSIVVIDFLFRLLSFFVALVGSYVARASLLPLGTLPDETADTLVGPKSTLSPRSLDQLEICCRLSPGKASTIIIYRRCSHAVASARQLASACTHQLRCLC